MYQQEGGVEEPDTQLEESGDKNGGYLGKSVEESACPTAYPLNLRDLRKREPAPVVEPASSATCV